MYKIIFFKWVLRFCVTSILITPITEVKKNAINNLNALGKMVWAKEKDIDQNSRP
jgi:hypothetical protein